MQAKLSHNQQSRLRHPAKFLLNFLPLAQSAGHARQGAGDQRLVAGLTAGNHDFELQLAKTVPWVFAFVLGLAFLVLMIAFRSVTFPLCRSG